MYKAFQRNRLTIRIYSITIIEHSYIIINPSCIQYFIPYPYNSLKVCTYRNINASFSTEVINYTFIENET